MHANGMQMGPCEKTRTHGHGHNTQQETRGRDQASWEVMWEVLILHAAANAKVNHRRGEHIRDSGTIPWCAPP